MPEVIEKLTVSLDCLRNAINKYEDYKSNKKNITENYLERQDDRRD